MTSMISPLYSICMCNYNMANTLAISLSSILDIIDDRFEVIVVDDGSNDSSQAILNNLMQKYSRLRIFCLSRDSKRKLGYTRNYGIQKARGQYIISHLDCDDVFNNHILDFVLVFHKIENALQRDILLSGSHINIAKKKLLLQYGAYQNIFRGEDRDLWSRLAVTDSWLILKHADFIKRLPKSSSEILRKIFTESFDHTTNDFRYGYSPIDYTKWVLSNSSNCSFKLTLLRLFCILPAYICAKFKSPLDRGLTNPIVFKKYQLRNTFTFRQLMEKYGHSSSLHFLASQSSRDLFK